jgi:hypothetical protein
MRQLQALGIVNRPRYCGAPGTAGRTASRTGPWAGTDSKEIAFSDPVRLLARTPGQVRPEIVPKASRSIRSVAGRQLKSASATRAPVVCSRSGAPGWSSQPVRIAAFRSGQQGAGCSRSGGRAVRSSESSREPPVRALRCDGLYFSQGQTYLQARAGSRSFNHQRRCGAGQSVVDGVAGRGIPGSSG